MASDSRGPESSHLRHPKEDPKGRTCSSQRLSCRGLKDFLATPRSSQVSEVSGSGAALHQGSFCLQTLCLSTGPNQREREREGERALQK